MFNWHASLCLCIICFRLSYSDGLRLNSHDCQQIHMIVSSNKVGVETYYIFPSAAFHDIGVGLGKRKSEKGTRCPMGLLPDTHNCEMHLHRECRERFPHHRLQMKPLVSDPGMHHGTCVTHVPWRMSGSLARCGGDNDGFFVTNEAIR